MMTLPLAGPAPRQLKKERVESVDALRGILAFGVMIYHYTLWSKLHPGSIPESLLRFLGLYGVELFFIISGFSLYYVYEQLPPLTGPAAVKFAIKRFFRIAPLYYLAVGLVLCLKLAAKHVLHDDSIDIPGATQLAANVSLLFGMWNPGESLVVGGWSIGVEMTFYLLFPFLVAAFRRGIVGRIGLAVSACIGAIIVDRFWMTPQKPLAEQWTNYITVANHLPFFIGGMMLVSLRRRIGVIDHVRVWPLLALLTGLAVVLCVNVADESVIVVGWRRYALTLLSFGMAMGVCCMPQLCGWMRRGGVFLGDISYSLYLLHFFSFTILQRLLPDVAPAWFIGLASIATLCAATLCHYTLERYFMQRGRSVSDWYSRRQLPIGKASESGSLPGNVDHQATRRAA